MIIHYLKASGFRMIGEPIDIRFPEEGRIGIFGHNESGKTTFLQAIEYALYGLKKGAGEERENLVTWGKNEARLEIQFTSGQETYILQRVFGAKSGHKASLVPLIDGVKDKSNSLTSLRDIDAKIEQITGTDRDSFTKLIYIKQKELDALKELVRSRREQLVNKVMGIEIFDDALSNIKNDSTNLEDELDKKTTQLDSVRKRKEQYETKSEDKRNLELSISEMRKDLDEKKKLVDEAKSLLAKYDWLYTFNSTSQIISSLNGQVAQVEKDIQKISALEDQIKTHETTLTKYKPEVMKLQSSYQKFLDLERSLGDAESAAESTRIKRQTIIEKSGLPHKDIELLSRDLSARKQRQLVTSLVALIGGMGLVVASLMLTYILLAASLPFFVASAYLFFSYMKTDRLQTTHTEINALTKQSKEQEENISKLKTQMETIRTETSLQSSEEINNQLLSISQKMKKETGEDSIEGIRAILRNTNDSLKQLTESKPVDRKTRLSDQIREKETEMAGLQNRKPLSVDDVKYDETQHEASKSRFAEAQEEHNDLDKNIRETLGKIQQLDKDLVDLKPDYDIFPELEKGVESYKYQTTLLKRVQLELSETSKELRNKVIPHARFIINQILPTLTDGRYSDFEITEDLKFKVHSNEAGGYKEREIFSGGTQDQFLIALRLAFTQSILDSRVMADKYSLLMDECIASSDDVRKQGIFQVLDEMKKTFSQIFIIAHEDISNFVDHHIMLARSPHGYTEIKSKSWQNA